jgi:hypothetical protein
MEQGKEGRSRNATGNVKLVTGTYERKKYWLEHLERTQPLRANKLYIVSLQEGVTQEDKKYEG